MFHLIMSRFPEIARQFFVEQGRKGGSAKSEKKTAAARRNIRIRWLRKNGPRPTYQ